MSKNPFKLSTSLPCDRCNKTIPKGSVEGKDFVIGAKYALYGVYYYFCMDCVNSIQKKPKE